MAQNNTRKALGKGLEQLFSSEQLDFNSFEKTIVDSTPKNEVEMIPLDQIRSNPYQPRVHFDEDSLQELADSIKDHGVFEPIIVKKSIKGYELVAGERRTKASRIAGLDRIPAIIKDFNDEEMMEIALLENIQRENLSPIEEAQAYRKFMDRMALTQDEVAKKFKKSRSYITNLLGLLNLPVDVQNSVMSHSISMSHARALSKLSDDVQIRELATKIENGKLSVRELEGIVSGEEVPKKKPIKKVKQVTSVKNKLYEDAIRELVGTKVQVGSNKIVIHFDSEKDLDRIMDLLNIEVGD
ncbi:MAG TPA: ParB/RepB/Spo0J family partition protein [Bacilli bacterium]|nr:ParB/RepB/Spo0J family partition protein [Bacilli bacterium]